MPGQKERVSEQVYRCPFLLSFPQEAEATNTEFQGYQTRPRGGGDGEDNVESHFMGHEDTCTVTQHLIPSSTWEVARRESHVRGD